MNLPFAESYKIKMVEAIRKSSREEREKWIKNTHYNLFGLKSEQVFIDLLTDSGTGAMSDKQWSEMMIGDESYAGARSFYKLKNTINLLTGFEYVLPTHQGRAAENVLFSVLIKDGDIIPGNSHFDTTKGHIEFRNARALDCTIDEAFDTTLNHPFKGNVDLKKLEAVLSNNPAERIPMIIITITCNSSGGQPVSIKNLREVKKMAEKYGIPVYIDAARFAENAYFIKKREKKYSDWTIKKIVREIFKYADGMTMSCKKDAIVNMGGFIALHNENIYRQTFTYSIMYEGYITYGGLSGRDMNAIAQGLDEGTDFDYLEARINQVEYLGQKLIDYGIPVQEPIGGHAIFLDAKKFLPQLVKEHYIGQTLAIEIYIEGGIRGVEIGTLLADRDPETKENRYPELELVRLALPRRVYTYKHLDYVISAIKNVFDRRNEIKTGYKIIREAPIMRHFTIELERIKN